MWIGREKSVEDMEIKERGASEHIATQLNAIFTSPSSHHQYVTQTIFYFIRCLFVVVLFPSSNNSCHFQFAFSGGVITVSLEDSPISGALQ